MPQLPSAARANATKQLRACDTEAAAAVQGYCGAQESARILPKPAAASTRLLLTANAVGVMVGQILGGQAQALPQRKKVNAECGTTPHRLHKPQHTTAQHAGVDVQLGAQQRLPNGKKAPNRASLSSDQGDWNAKKQQLLPHSKHTNCCCCCPCSQATDMLLLSAQTVDAACMRCRCCCLCSQATDMLLHVQAAQVRLGFNVRPPRTNSGV
jgi:hypothetical protein